MSETAAMLKEKAPFGPAGRRSLGWWGVMMLIAAEAALFAYLLFSYYFAATQLSPEWLPAKPPDLKLALPNTFILLLSSVLAWRGEKNLLNNKCERARLWLAGAFLLGSVFTAIQYFEWSAKHIELSSGPFGSYFFTITGFHMAHVLVGLIAFATLHALFFKRLVTPARSTAALGVIAYWHFVDVVWLFVFSSLYLGPRIW